MKEVNIIESFPLYTHHSIDWSEEGKIAVAVSNKVKVVSLDSDGIERSSESDDIVVKDTRQVAEPLGVVLVSPDEKLPAGSYYSNNNVRAVYWSPMGFSRDGNCLLAALTSESNCVIYKCFQELVGELYKPVNNLFLTLMEQTVDMDAEYMTQATMDKIRVRAVTWGSKLLDCNFLALGTESGELLVVNVIDTLAETAIDIVGQTLIKPDALVIDLVWQPWKTLDNGKSQSVIVYVLSDNSIGTIEINYSSNTLKLSTKKNELKAPNRCKVRDLKIIESKDGPVVMAVTAAQIHSFYLNTGVSFTHPLPKYGETFVFYKQLKTTILIVFLDSLITPEIVHDEQDAWLATLQLSAAAGFHNLIVGTRSYPLIGEFFSRKFSLLDTSGLPLIKIFGAQQSLLKDNIVISYQRSNFLMLDSSPISEFKFNLKFIPTIYEKEEHVEDYIWNLDDWVCGHGGVTNYVLEKRILLQKYARKLKLDNRFLCKKYENVLSQLLDTKVKFKNVSVKKSELDLLLAIKTRQMFFHNDSIKKLQFFYLFIKKVDPPTYTVYETPTVDERQERYAEYEENLSLFVKSNPRITNAILDAVSSIVIDYIDRYNVDLSNVYDKAIYYNMLMLRKQIQQKDAAEIEKDVVLSFKLYDGLYNLDFNFNFEKNANLDLIVSVNGLKWQRCSLTFLPVTHADMKHCSICQKSFWFPKEVSDKISSSPANGTIYSEDTSLISGSVLLNFLLATFNKCIYCGATLKARA